MAEHVFSGKQSLRPSENDYDWLGDGVYFWEHNAQRAYDFACEIQKQPRRHKPKVKDPAVIGAIIDLGFCLNLLDSRFIETVREAHEGLVEFARGAGTPLPRNSVGPDLLARKLDCAVIRFLHRTRVESGDEPFDTVRAAFFEGDRLYESAGFTAKSHIQVCVRNIASIRGYFRPLDEDGRPISFR